MTDQETKEWLDWTVEQKLCEIITSGAKWGNAYYLIRDKKRIYIASAGKTLIVSYALQLVLQEEIAKQGWTFELETYSSGDTSVLIREGMVTLAGEDGEGILEAFMLAFRQSWEATHG